jgi:hypothetical protein
MRDRAVRGTWRELGVADPAALMAERLFWQRSCEPDTQITFVSLPEVETACLIEQRMV